MQSDLKNILAEVKSVLQKLYGTQLAGVVLYGSYARGDQDENSDIDLLIVLKSLQSAGREIDRIVDVIYDINLKYNTLISIIPVSYQDYLNIQSPLLCNIRREGKKVA